MYMTLGTPSCYQRNLRYSGTCTHPIDFDLFDPLEIMNGSLLANARGPRFRVHVPRQSQRAARYILMHHALAPLQYSTRISVLIDNKVRSQESGDNSTLGPGEPWQF